MFENLTDRLSGAMQRIRGKGRLTEDSIREALREVRVALLEADVALPVVKDFIAQVRERALGQEVLKSLTPGQALVKVVNDELIRVMGEENQSLNLNAAPPVVVTATHRRAYAPASGGEMSTLLGGKGSNREGFIYS